MTAPRMPRVAAFERRSQPFEMLVAEMGAQSSEILLIPRSWAFGLVEEYDVWPENGYAESGLQADLRKGHRDAEVSPESPVRGIGLLEENLHNLSVWPFGVEFVSRKLQPISLIPENSCAADDLPPSPPFENIAQCPLVSTVDGHLDVLVMPCLTSEIEIHSPTSDDVPGDGVIDEVGCYTLWGLERFLRGRKIAAHQGLDELDEALRQEVLIGGAQLIQGSPANLLNHFRRSVPQNERSLGPGYKVALQVHLELAAV
jgi:hypothetical protein